MTSGKPNTTSGSNRNNAQAAKAAQQSGVNAPAAITPATSGKRGKREQIVKAAVKIFLEKGFAATSMNAVAEEAGVIKATIYSHFKDKEQLFAAIIQEITLKKVPIDLANPEPMLALAPEEFIDLFTDKFCRLLKDPEYHALFRVLIGEAERFPQLANIYVRTVIMPSMGLVTKYYEMHKELEISDAQATAHICAGSFISLMLWQQILGGEKLLPIEASRVKETLKAMILRPLKDKN